MLIKWKNLFVGTLSLLFMGSTLATVVLDKTKIVFDGSDQEMAVNIQNTDNTPTLVQSWISKEDKSSKDFIVTPPLFRLEGQNKASLRVVKMNQNLPKDRESLYYLNVKSVAPNDPNLKNRLNLAVNSKISLRYRPDSLSQEGADNAYKKLTFAINGNYLIVKNPTAYYVPFSRLELGNKKIKNPGYIAPFADAKYTITKPISKYEVKWQSGQNPVQTKQIH